MFHWLNIYKSIPKGYNITFLLGKIFLLLSQICFSLITQKYHYRLLIITAVCWLKTMFTSTTYLEFQECNHYYTLMYLYYSYKKFLLLKRSICINYYTFIFLIPYIFHSTKALNITHIYNNIYYVVLLCYLNNLCAITCVIHYAHNYKCYL